MWQLRRSPSFDADTRRNGMAVYAAVALGFASVAIPLQLDRQWITLGWALERAAVLVLFRRIDRRADGERHAPVRLGPVSSNPLYTATPPLAFAARHGALVDARLYSHQRPLAVAPSSEGLVRVALSPADLGQLRPDLGDIRVVDAAGRQWPYLVDREPSSESVPLELSPPERHGTASRTALALPSAPLAASALLLDASDPYFDRSYQE